MRLTGQETRAWAPRLAPRRLRSILAQWPVLESDADPAIARLGALVLGTSLERPELPLACLAALPPKTLIIELAAPRRRVLRGLLGLEQQPLARARAGQSRVLNLLARGCHELEQWESVEPQGIVVTLARVR